MASFGSTSLARALGLSLWATAVCACAAPAQAQPWSWFVRAPAALPKPSAPAAIPVPTLKGGFGGPVRSSVRETPDDVRRISAVTREFSALAERMGIEAALQLDPTLRRGDIAVTSTGLHVFQGARAGFHPESDFRPLAQSRLARRPDLAALQTAGRYERPSASTRAAFLEVLTIRPSRPVVDVSPRTGLHHGFRAVEIPRMR